MKIAMLGHKRIPSREGGVEIVVGKLSQMLVKKGHEVTVYNRKGAHVSLGREMEKRKDYHGVKLVTVFTLENRNLNAIVYAFLATCKIIVKKVDVVHYHAEGPSIMLPLAKLFGKKCVVTIHGLDWQREKWLGIGQTVLHFGEKLAAKYADEVIVLSKNVQDYFMKTYGRKTHFIPNGIDIPEKRDAAIIRHKWDVKGNDYILFLARIVPEKGLHYLVEAYKNLETDKNLVIVGGSSHSEEYFNSIKGEVATDPRIIMTGFLQGEELEEWYSNAYAYVLPSDIEGMPISLLEAMSYGNLCIVSDIAENKEVIGDCGLLFEKGNVADLQRVLETALTMEPETYQQLKQKSKTMVETKYPWDNVVDETIKVYEMVAKGKK